jgi:signal transduction histidine kinase
MGELAASVAHELNNPLATVSLRVEMLQAQILADDPKQQVLTIVAQEIDRMSTLVANLLQFSRRSTPQRSTLALQEEIAKSLELLSYHLRNHHITVEQDFTDTVPPIQADRQQLRQMLLNLFTNAVDAMPQGGTLTIRMYGVEQHVVIEIIDMGVGITPEDLPKMMDPFFTTKPEGRGTGLGLPICRRIVQDHRGTLEIFSAGPGKGTTVRLTFPCKDDVNAESLRES